MSNKFIEEISNEAPKELLIELGMAITIHEGELGARPPSDQELVNRALTWLEENRQAISNLIHDDPKLKSLAYEQRDKQLLFSAFADALMSSFTGVPVATLATLVVHYSLDHFLKRKKVQKEDCDDES